MSGVKFGDPFGLDNSYINKIDWKIALKRVVHDQRTDFIYAPHLSYIYRKAGEELIEHVKKELRSGNYIPGSPITIEVPKPFRIRVASPLKRVGPNFSRPGSILLPWDRLLYQALADQAAPIIDKKTNKSRSFSHLLADGKTVGMFLPTRVCWSKFQAALSKYSDLRKSRYILKIDMANFFGSINQHTMINVLSDAGYPKPLRERLETLLISYTGERSSRGILQGIYPSDLFGNYYLDPVDRFLDDLDIPSARYVDDVYIFLETVDAADQLFQKLIPILRSYDLVINEAKAAIMPKHALMTEEPDLEVLFTSAVREISSQVDEEDFDADYGFQSEWDEKEDDESKEDLELQATIKLFDSLADYPGQEENIERFCLPLFSKAGSDYAINHVMDSFKKRPSMSQIYASYLAKFLNEEEDVPGFLFGLLKDLGVSDWQKMWVLAALLQLEEADDAEVKIVLELFRDANRHEALRAVAAIYVGRFGDHVRRKALSAAYTTASDYVKSAIYFSSIRWPPVEKTTARATWGKQGLLQRLLTSAMGN